MGNDSAPCKKTLICESKPCYNKTSKSLTYANGNVLRGVKVWYNNMTEKQLYLAYSYGKGMDVMKKKQMLATLVMLSLLQGSVYAAEPVYDKVNNIYYGNGTPITINDKIGTNKMTNIIGSGSETATGTITGGDITVNGGVMHNVIGGAAEQGTVFNNHVEINGGTFEINGGTFEINGGTFFDECLICGGQVVGSYANGNANGNAYGNSVSINADIKSDDKGIVVCGAMVKNGNVNNNIVNINNGEVNNVFGGHVELEYGYKNAYDISQNGVIIKNAKADVVCGGYSFGGYSMGDVAEVHEYKIHENYVVVGAGGEVALQLVAGGALNNADVINNKVILCENSKVSGMVAAAFTNGTEAEISGNSINLLKNADVSKANLYGYLFGEDLGAVSSDKVSNNNLVIDKGWSGSTLSVQNFNNINFENIKWSNGGTVLNITDNAEDGALADTNINIKSLNFAGGTQLNTGDSMTFVKGTDLGIDATKVTIAPEFTAGVGTVGTGDVEVDENSVKYTLTEVKQNSQIDLVAKNRAVAAAFINQGTDLIADSLDTLSRDGKYGVKTFAAVHGNRSKYDVNSDIKINGWSTIVGVGAENEHNGGDFSWGVFYENGSGNYRTYNDFNNEFFRGDGSLVYNGGGIAARYENSHGVYTEGSLRAGMLKSEMTDALSDDENKYGYESETAYYGAHIGVGKIFSLGDDSDLDVYGKFFHTYTEGDSFNVADDEFEFDSINSDRLRIGARVTSNKENKFSTYYGLAYEYEFNGDAEMRAAGMKAPTQSLQGSSVMAEIGLNYQPTPESPWSFDLNMRGYAGERQGGSFNVQATYTF